MPQTGLPELCFTVNWLGVTKGGMEVCVLEGRLKIRIVTIDDHDKRNTDG